MKTGDSVLFNYKNKTYAGEITAISLQIHGYAIYNVKCGESEFEIHKFMKTGEITDIIKL